jgi:hypothetical protein
MSRWVQLSDPPARSPPSSAPTSAEVTEARTIGDRVLAVLELRSASGSPTAPSGFAALFDVDADQILRIGCSSTVSSAPHRQASGG